MNAPLPWRLLTCTRCWRQTLVLYIPDDRECDPATWVCGACMRPKGAA